MTIQKQHVKLMEAQRMHQFSDGGGFMTAREIIGGKSNNMFDDVSNFDRVYGSIDLVKSYLAISTTDTDTFYGATAIISKLPDDEYVGAIIFSTKSWSDIRDDARRHIENYLVKNVKLHGQILDTQYKGQRKIQLLMSPADAPPEIGDTLYLVEDEGKGTEHSEYVRLTKVESYLRLYSFSGSAEPVMKKVVNCDIGAALRYDYDGGPPQKYDDVKGRAYARETVVIDAARYYSAKSLVKPIVIGDLKINVGSIFSSIVPASQSEIILQDQAAGGENLSVVKSGQEIRLTLNTTVSNGTRVYLNNACMPGTLKIQVSGGQLTDKNGQLYSGDVVIGTIDYPTGVVYFGSTSGIYAGAKTIIFNAASAPIRIANTASIFINEATQGKAHVLTLSPVPEPTALLITYMSQNKWYTLKDLGSGLLKDPSGDDTLGMGTIDYVTGTASLSLESMPDVGSQIIFSWSPSVSYFDRSGSFSAAPSHKFTLSPQLSPNNLVLNWERDGVAKTATDNGTGILIGDATGVVNYLTGELTIVPTQLVAPNTQIDAGFHFGNESKKTFNEPSAMGDGYHHLQLDDGGIVPGTLRISFPVAVHKNSFVSPITPDLIPPISLKDTGLAEVTDDGSGNLKGLFGVYGGGTIDYAAGLIKIKPIVVVSVPVPIYTLWPMGNPGLAANDPKNWAYLIGGWDYSPKEAIMPVTGGYFDVKYRADTSNNHINQALVVDTLTLRLNAHQQENIVRDSLSLEFGGKRYVDRGGSIYTDIDLLTNAGTAAGRVDYNTGSLTLTNWSHTGSNTGTITSLLTQIGDNPVDYIVLRIPTAPIREASLQIRATRLDGSTVTAMSDRDGKVIDTGINGTVDYVTGIVTLKFGELVNAAGNEGQHWYNINAVKDGMIFRPIPVLADSIKYNAISVSWLPLDADLLGLDPVRLPNDGKVPIYRRGDLVVVHESINKVLPALAVGQDYDLGIERLSSVQLLDHSNLIIPDDVYDVDLDAGIITIKKTLVGYMLPITAECRIEDQSVITDAFINGDLMLNRPMTHNFTKNAICSSALIIDNLKARYSKLFSQVTWNSKWQDTPDSNPTTSSYNDIDYPIAVSNIDCVQERWVLIFTSATAFRIVGESLGQVGTGTTSEDCKPLNPNTNTPYFTMKAAGFGGGWGANNAIRFNTAGANYPIWSARVTLLSQPSKKSDVFTIQLRGDINRD